MQKKIQIINPCSQDWNQMMDFNENKFCSKCEKEVIDFTGFSRREISEKIDGSNEVCVKIKKSQLDFNLRTKRFENRYLNKFTFLIGLGTFIGFSEPIFANKTENQTELSQKTDWKSILPKRELIDTITIVGNVIGSDSIPLPGTDVIFKGSNISTVTDFDGNFELKIPKEKLSKENFLIFSFIGFKTKEYKLSNSDNRIDVELTVDAELEQEVVILGGISYKQSIFRKVGYFFHNLFFDNKTSN